MSRKGNEPDTLRITDQHRSKESMVYDLRCKEARLTLSVTRRGEATPEQDWRIDAQSGRGAEARVITACGATRADALRLVGEAWASNEQVYGLPHFDWTAVATALAAVRAL
jgi:hypothetical protein